MARRLRADCDRAASAVFLLGLVFIEPSFEDRNGRAEVVVEMEEQVDVVEVLIAPEAVGEVVAWVDVGEHFAAARTEEAEASLLNNLVENPSLRKPALMLFFGHGTEAWSRYSLRC